MATPAARHQSRVDRELLPSFYRVLPSLGNCRPLNANLTGVANSPSPNPIKYTLNTHTHTLDSLRGQREKKKQKRTQHHSTGNRPAVIDTPTSSPHHVHLFFLPPGDVVAVVVVVCVCCVDSRWSIERRPPQRAHLIGANQYTNRIAVRVVWPSRAAAVTSRLDESTRPGSCHR